MGRSYIPQVFSTNISEAQKIAAQYVLKQIGMFVCGTFICVCISIAESFFNAPLILPRLHEHCFSSLYSMCFLCKSEMKAFHLDNPDSEVFTQWQHFERHQHIQQDH